MTESPGVSVVVPVHNNEATVGRTISSLLAQRAGNIEIVLVLDGCSDQSEKAVHRSANHDRRLRIVKLEENLGVMAARARGLSETTAPFVGFADADDVAKPEMYGILSETMRSNQADIVVCGADRLSEGRKLLGPKVSFRRDYLATRNIFDAYCGLRFGSGVVWNKLYRRSLILKHGLAQPRWRQDTSEDTIVNIGCFLEARRVAVVKKSLYEYIEREGSATAYKDRAAALCGLVRGYAAALEVYSNRPPCVLAGITRLYLKQSEMPAYRVDDPYELLRYEESVVQALRVILRVYPAGLTLVAQDPEIWRSYSLRKGIANIRAEIRGLVGLIFERARERLS